MSVVVSIEEVGPCRKQLTVEVPAPAVEAETQRVVADFRRQRKVPGFRKGKVPAELVRRRFGEAIQQEVVDRLVGRYWKQATAETRIEPLLPPRVDSVESEPGAPLTFVASVETRPEIELGELGEFELPDPPVELPDEELEAALAQLAREHGEWSPVERAAADGDLVHGELAEEAAADEAGGAPPRPVRFEVGAPQVWEELTSEARGRQAGEEARFIRRAPDGSEQAYRLRIDGVEQRVPAALDDALAERVGGFGDLAELRRALADRLRRDKEAARRQLRRQALAEQLTARYPLALPEGVVEREVEALLREYAEGLAMRGVDVERADVDWRQLAERVRPQARSRVHLRLLLDAIAEQQEVEPAAQELEAALAGIARVEGRSTQAVRHALDRSGGLAKLKAQLRREKVLRQLAGDAPEGACGGAGGESPAAEPAAAGAMPAATETAD